MCFNNYQKVHFLDTLLDTDQYIGQLTKITTSGNVVQYHGVNAIEFIGI